MLDKHFVTLLRSPLTCLAKRLALYRIRPNQVTVTGFMLGLLALPSLYYQAYEHALFFILVNRLFDGIDGALARLDRPTDLGGYLDITLDFIFYACVVFGFALADSTNALAAAFLLFSFIGTGSSFLAFAIMAQKRNLHSMDYGSKSLFYLGGLTEGAETIGFFVLVCLFPQKFALLAWFFGGMCWLTTMTRVYAGWRTLK